VNRYPRVRRTVFINVATLNCRARDQHRTYRQNGRTSLGGILRS
jgi:hypothetical protein